MAKVHRSVRIPVESVSVALDTLYISRRKYEALHKLLDPTSKLLPPPVNVAECRARYSRKVREMLQVELIEEDKAPIKQIGKRRGMKRKLSSREAEQSSKRPSLLRAAAAAEVVSTDEDEIMLDVAHSDKPDLAKAVIGARASPKAILDLVLSIALRHVKKPKFEEENTVHVKLTADGRRLSRNEIRVSVVPLNAGLNVAAGINVLPVVLCRGKETPELYTKLLSHIMESFASWAAYGYPFGDKRYNFKYSLAADMKTLWTLLDGCNSASPCPYCTVDRDSLWECGEERVVKLIGPWMPPHQVVFCSLHAVCRITENLLKTFAGMFSRTSNQDSVNSVLEKLGVRFQLEVKEVRRKKDAETIETFMGCRGSLDGKEVRLLLLNIDKVRKINVLGATNTSPHIPLVVRY